LKIPINEETFSLRKRPEGERHQEATGVLAERYFGKTELRAHNYGDIKTYSWGVVQMKEGWVRAKTVKPRRI